MDNGTHAQDGPPQAVETLEFPRVEQASAAAEGLWHDAHQAFAAGISQKLPQWFQNAAGASFTFDESAPTAEELITDRSGGCTIAMRANGLADAMYLRFDQAAQFLWIDCMLGGCGAGIPPHRQLTSLEQQLIRCAATEILGVWNNAYRGPHALTPTISDIVQPRHALPDNLQRVPFELRVGPARGQLSVVVSQGDRARLVERSNSPLNQAGRVPSPEAINRLGTSRVELVVHLAQLTVRTSELMGLQVGDIITTDTHHEDLVSVHVEGKPRFQATVGSLHGHKAIRFAG